MSERAVVPMDVNGHEGDPAYQEALREGREFVTGAGHQGVVLAEETQMTRRRLASASGSRIPMPPQMPAESSVSREEAVRGLQHVQQQTAAAVGTLAGETA